MMHRKTFLYGSDSQGYPSPTSNGGVPRNLLEMKILGLYNRLLESDTRGIWPAICVLIIPQCYYMQVNV